MNMHTNPEGLNRVLNVAARILKLGGSATTDAFREEEASGVMVEYSPPKGRVIVTPITPNSRLQQVRGEVGALRREWVDVAPGELEIPKDARFAGRAILPRPSDDGHYTDMQLVARQAGWLLLLGPDDLRPDVVVEMSLDDPDLGPTFPPQPS